MNNNRQVNKIDYLEDSFDCDYSRERIRNPFTDWDYFTHIFLSKMKAPFDNEEIARDVWNKLHIFREKYSLHREYVDKNSSLKEAKKMLSLAKKMKEQFDKTRVWDYYYDTGDMIDIHDGLDKAIRATERMFSYAFEKKNKKPNIRNAKRELILDLAKVWERGMKVAEGEVVVAQENASQKGLFLNFVYSVLSIFSLLPEASTYYETEKELERLERQALKKQIIGAFSTKLPSGKMVNPDIIYQ